MPLAYSAKPLDLADIDGVHIKGTLALKNFYLENINKYEGTLNLSNNFIFMAAGMLFGTLIFLPWKNLRGLKLSNASLPTEDIGNLSLFLNLFASDGILLELYLDHNSHMRDLNGHELETFFSSLPKSLNLLNLEGTHLQKEAILRAINRVDFKPSSLKIRLHDGEVINAVSPAPGPSTIASIRISHRNNLLKTGLTINSEESKSSTIDTAPQKKLPASELRQPKSKARPGTPLPKSRLNTTRPHFLFQPHSLISSATDIAQHRDKDQQLGKASDGVINHGRRSGMPRDARLFSSSSAARLASPSSPLVAADVGEDALSLI